MSSLRAFIAGLFALSTLPAAFVGLAAWSDSARDTSGDANLAALIALGWVVLALGAAVLLMPKWQWNSEGENA